MRPFTKDVIRTIIKGLADGKIEYAGNYAEVRFQPVEVIDNCGADDALCPITAWHWLKTGDFVSVNDFESVAITENARYEERDQIANAADRTLAAMRDSLEDNSRPTMMIDYPIMSAERVRQDKIQIRLRRLYRRFFKYNDAKLASIRERSSA